MNEAFFRNVQGDVFLRCLSVLPHIDATARNTDQAIGFHAAHAIAGCQQRNRSPLRNTRLVPLLLATSIIVNATFGYAKRTIATHSQVTADIDMDTMRLGRLDIAHRMHGLILAVADPLSVHQGRHSVFMGLLQPPSFRDPHCRG